LTSGKARITSSLRAAERSGKTQTEIGANAAQRNIADPTMIKIPLTRSSLTSNRPISDTERGSSCGQRELLGPGSGYRHRAASPPGKQAIFEVSQSAAALWHAIGATAADLADESRDRDVAGGIAGRPSSRPRSRSSATAMPNCSTSHRQLLSLSWGTKPSFLLMVITELPPRSSLVARRCKPTCASAPKSRPYSSPSISHVPSEACQLTRHERLFGTTAVARAIMLGRKVDLTARRPR
jgi:hypothetical protein